jgi:hypothetical protein
MFNEIIKEIILYILGLAIPVVFGWLGVQLKKLAAKYLDNLEKKAVARTVVQFVEQVFTDLHGEEKLHAALNRAAELLAEKGIKFSALEMETLIEAAVAEFNEAFHKKSIEE